MMSTVTDKAADVGEQAQEQAREVVTYVRENPIPAILIGAGVMWLFMRSRGREGSSYSGSPRGGDRYARYRTASAGPDRVEVQPLSGTGAGTSGRAMEYGGRHYGGSRRGESTLERWMRENPLTVGAVAIAAGAVVGLGLPRTAKEDEWLGETRDTLVDRARDTAQSAVERVAEVAEEAQNTVSGASASASSSESGAASGSAAGSTSGAETASSTASQRRPLGDQKTAGGGAR